MYSYVVVCKALQHLPVTYSLEAYFFPPQKAPKPFDCLQALHSPRPDPLAGFKEWAWGKGKERSGRRKGEKEGGWTPPIFETRLRPCGKQPSHDWHGLEELYTTVEHRTVAPSVFTKTTDL